MTCSCGRWKLIPSERKPGRMEWWLVSDGVGFKLTGDAVCFDCGDTVHAEGTITRASEKVARDDL